MTTPPISSAPMEHSGAANRAKATLRKNFHLAYRMQTALKALSDFQIKPISPELIKQVERWKLEIETACQNEKSPPKKWIDSRSILRRIVRDELALCWENSRLFAVCADVCCGMIVTEAHSNQARDLFIHYLATSSDNILHAGKRKRGAATALLIETARIAVIYGKKELFLCTGFGADNAQSFYRNLGFVSGENFSSIMKLPKERFFQLLANLYHIRLKS